MIWRRTVVLFVAALLGSAVIGLEIHREDKAYGEQLSNCRIQATGDGARYRTFSQDTVPDVGFKPCFSERPVSDWFKILVVTVFLLWIGFFSSLSQDCFLYFRARRRKLVTGEFRWFR
jgi:hypothetical protein